MEGLGTVRDRIDQIDKELIELIARRLDLCRQAAVQKQASGLPMMQLDRVREVKDRCARLATDRDVSPAFIRDVYTLIITEACRIEKPMMTVEQTCSSLERHGQSIDHFALAVRDLSAAEKFFVEKLGFVTLGRRVVEGRRSGMDSIELSAGPLRIVVAQGKGPESNVCRYIEHYGPGIQHIAFAVSDITAMQEDLRRRGVELLGPIFRSQRLQQFFTKRDAVSGMQFEFIQRDGTDGFEAANVQGLFEAMEREDAF